MTGAGKKNSGFTLVELLVTMALLSVVVLAVGAAMVAASRSYALTVKMQEDEYNARLALLAMARDIHRGVAGSLVTGEGTLSFESAEGGTVTYSLSDGRLTRSGGGFAGFVSAELRAFSSRWDNGRIRLTAECTNGLSLETVIAVLRTAA